MDITGLGGVADFFSKVVDKIFPDATLAAQAKAAFEQAQQAGQLQEILAQIEVNKIEASSVNWFVAGWRPFVGWMCALAFGYSAIVAPALHLPAADTSLLSQILIGLLGIAGMRTYEKSQGAEGNR